MYIHVHVHVQCTSIYNTCTWTITCIEHHNAHKKERKRKKRRHTRTNTHVYTCIWWTCRYMYMYLLRSSWSPSRTKANSSWASCCWKPLNLGAYLPMVNWTHTHTHTHTSEEGSRAAEHTSRGFLPWIWEEWCFWSFHSRGRGSTPHTSWPSLPPSPGGCSCH